MATYDREAEAARFSGEAQTALYLATALEVSRRRIGSSSVRGCESAPRAQVGALSVGGLVAAQMIDVTGIIAASSLALAGVRAFFSPYVPRTPYSLHSPRSLPYFRLEHRDKRRASAHACASCKSASTMPSTSASSARCTRSTRQLCVPLTRTRGLCVSRMKNSAKCSRRSRAYRAEAVTFGLNSTKQTTHYHPIPRPSARAQSKKSYVADL